MVFTDTPLEQLRSYRPTVREPEDFDRFWADTISQARSAGGEATITRWDGPGTALEMFDVTFPGFGGEPIRAWLIQPADITEPLPCVVQFQGYGGSRGLPFEHLAWANAGFVHLFVDTRGQGVSWGTGGATPDPHGSDGQVAGMMTKGISDPATYYYRRFFTDGVRAVDFVHSLEQVDSTRVAVYGGSQGGGAALAVGALAEQVAAVMADVPFLCHYERAVTITDSFPYQELVKYLKTFRGSHEWLFDHLAYFDGVNFSKRIQATTRVSVALMDDICPPSTIFAAVNHMPQPPELDIYPYNNHEGGQAEQVRRLMTWLVGVFG